MQRIAPAPQPARVDVVFHVERRMPEISRFFGIVVTMHYADHAPPHFHARYGEHRAAIALQPARLLAGGLPPRVLGFVIEWATTHQTELLDDWILASEGKPLRPIDPLG